MALCKICLGTIIADGTKCDHAGQKMWQRSFCNAGQCSYLLCSNCSKHLGGQQWFKHYHDHKNGLRNYSQIVKDLTPTVVASYVGMVTCLQGCASTSVPLAELTESPT